LIRSAAGKTFYRELQTTEENNVNGTALAQCSATIMEYDTNDDGEIDRDEYVTLVMNQLGVEDYEPGSVSFIDLPLPLIGVYNIQICGGQDCSSDENIDITDDSVVEDMCTRIIDFIGALESPSVSPTNIPSSEPTGAPTAMPTFKPSPKESAQPSCGADPVSISITYPITTTEGLSASDIINETGNTVKANLIEGLFLILTEQPFLNNGESRSPFTDENFKPSIDSVTDSPCDVDDLEYSLLEMSPNCPVVSSTVTVFSYCETDVAELESNIISVLKSSLLGNEFCRFFS